MKAFQVRKPEMMEREGVIHHDTKGNCGMIDSFSGRRPLRYRCLQGAFWLAERCSWRYRLDVAGLERQAREITGRQFQGTVHRPRLERLVASIRDEAALNALGRVAAAGTIVRMLVTRLCMEEIWGGPEPTTADLLHPARPPIFIVGMPRTGTTALHKLLAADPAARTLPLWEAAFPVMVPTRDAARRTAAARQAAAVHTFTQMKRVAPELSGIHELDPFGADECHWLLVNTVADYIFHVRWRVPEYERFLAGLAESEWDSIYREYLGTLRLLDGGQTDRHWVFKHPFHAPRIGTLARLVPDAIFVQTYRDVGEVVGSFCSLVSTMRGISSDTVDPRGDGADTLRLLARFAGESEAAAARVEDRVVRIHYKTLLADPLAVIRKIYERAGIAWTSAGAAAMTGWLAEHPQDRHGRHRYSLEQFGLDDRHVRSACAAYDAQERTLAAARSA